MASKKLKPNECELKIEMLKRQRARIKRVANADGRTIKSLVLMLVAQHEARIKSGPEILSFPDRESL